MSCHMDMQVVSPTSWSLQYEFKYIIFPEQKVEGKNLIEKNKIKTHQNKLPERS